MEKQEKRGFRIKVMMFIHCKPGITAINCPRHTTFFKGGGGE